MSDRTAPAVSVVVPVLDEEDNVPALLARFDEIAAANPGYDFEFVVVDDGSTDRTLEMLDKARTERDDLVVVVLSRNFGSHYAISAGLDEASGESMIVVGGDLQEPVELIGQFLERRRHGCDVVWGVRNQRIYRSRLARWASALFSRLLTGFSDLPDYPREGPSGFLCSRDVVDVVTRLPERNRNLLGLISWLGFNQCQVAFDIQDRAAGVSKWTTKKKVKMAVDSFVEFSFAPIRFMTYLGISVALLGFAYALLLVVRRLFWEVQLEGWTTVVVVVLVLGGLQLVLLGVLGEYLWRTADESRRRPLYIVRETLRPGGDGVRSGGAHVDPAHEAPLPPA